MAHGPQEPAGGFLGRLVSFFADSKLTPLFVLASILLGVFAVWQTPREEEPQIIVPMVDVFVQMPGASAKEVEERVTSPMEELLWEIPGVEYIYSTSSPGQSLAVVRFYVGQNLEDSLIKLYNKLYSNFDRIPAGVSEPLIKPRSIDDVPILALTFWGEGYDSFTLRQLAAAVEEEVKQITDVSETTLIGGQRRQINVTLDPARLAGFNLAPAAVVQVLQTANQELPSGDFDADNVNFQVETGRFLANAEDVANLVVGTFQGRPVYLRDVAEITDGPEEPNDYVLHLPGATASHGDHQASGHEPVGGTYPAVTLAVAKRQGTNAIVIAERVLEKVQKLRGTLIPEKVHLTITRNYGETANEKANELLKHMGLALLSVTLLIAFVLGRREAGVVALAVPVTLALTLFVFYLLGFTLNRITLFALIFSIGILVDDPIVDVENIVRHFRMPQNRGRPLLQVTIEAVNEVRSPLILATLAVMAAILPMGFVRGLMGPYMRPIPIGASAAMFFSMVVAFVVTPWAAYRVLRGITERDPEALGHGETETRSTRLYRRVAWRLVTSRRHRNFFLAGLVGLLLLAVALIPLKVVRVKMLPFDNKSEFQVVLDLPEGTTLEETARVAREVGEYLQTVPEVVHSQLYVGTASPYNFNGLVRHYYLRRGPNVADVQVNLRPKHHRKAQSHDIAKRVRPALQAIAAKYGARLKVSEVPPGPPVLQTLVAEVYGPSYDRQIEVARQILDLFDQTEGVADADWYMEDPQPKVQFVVDQEKAALNGVSTEQIAYTLRLAVNGMPVGLVHRPEANEDINIVLRLPRAERSSVEDLREIRVVSQAGRLIPLGELVRVEETQAEHNIYHKNLMPVVYVTADVAGREESPVYAILKLNRAIANLHIPEGYEVKRYTTRQPFVADKLALKWDGEWHITYEVFRDLGIAFAAVLILIYVLVVGWFQSFKTPIVIMSAIPFSLVGILPAHALMGAFFTATSMIGFIAGAGIVVRNSIILIDFIELRRREGMSLEEAVVDAGAVRFRPMMLTAAAVVVGTAVILLDPIFQGLAISLMAGEVASLFLSRIAVPVLYYLSERKRQPASASVEPGEEEKPNHVPL